MRDRNRMGVKVGDIVFSISSDRDIDTILIEGAYQDFRCTEESDVTIHAYYDSFPRISLRDEGRIFDSEMIWSLYRFDERHVFVLKSPIAGPLPYRIAVFTPDFRHGEVYSRVLDPRRSVGLLPNPLEFPLSEVLMVCLLAQGRGLMVHACGVDDNGRGYLFTGNSTHGKTTMARLWRDEAIVLNDDRIVLRWREGRLWMYGTPWHGEYTHVSPEGVEVDKIFFLLHGSANEVHRWNGVAATALLLTRSFLPLWNEGGMRFTLDFCARLVAEVPCSELSFVPNKSVLDFVRCES